MRWIIAKLGGNVANFRAKLNAKPLKSLGALAVLVALGTATSYIRRGQSRKWLK